MKRLLFALLLIQLMACRNETKKIKQFENLTNNAATTAADTLLDDTVWYPKYSYQFEKLSHGSIKDSFLANGLEKYFTIDDETLFADLSCKYKFCKKEHISDYLLTIDTKPFDSSKHIFRRTKTNFIYLIDEKIFWGTDGSMPHIEIDSFSISYKAQKINIPSTEYNDLYNCTGDWEKLHLIDKQHNYIIFLMQCSDGAGSYVVAWVLEKGKYIRRIVDLYKLTQNVPTTPLRHNNNMDR